MLPEAKICIYNETRKSSPQKGIRRLICQAEFAKEGM